MTAPYGTRRIEITSMARARMTPDERHEVESTCRTRGFRLSIMYSQQQRGYEAIIVAGGTVYRGFATLPTEAFRRALALRDGPSIVSLLTGPAS